MPLAPNALSKPLGRPPLTFAIAIDRVLGIEGGYVNDPQDPGGETKYGISKRSYPQIDIKTLTRDGAKDLYLRDFWNVIDADQLHPAVTYQVLDFAVNSGMGTAIRYLQRALGVADDGHFGPVSRAAAEAMPDWRLIMRLDAERLDFMSRLKNWKDAGAGWARRIAQDLIDAADDITPT